MIYMLIVSCLKVRNMFGKSSELSEHFCLEVRKNSERSELFSEPISEPCPAAATGLCNGCFLSSLSIDVQQAPIAYPADSLLSCQVRLRSSIRCWSALLHRNRNHARWRISVEAVSQRFGCCQRPRRCWTALVQHFGKTRRRIAPPSSEFRL